MIPGIDVSHYQGPIDWGKVAAAGKRFAFMKATQGANFVDPTHAWNVSAARAAGLATASYHYLEPSASTPLLAQVENFRRAVGPLLTAAHGIAVDVELSAITVEDVREFMTYFPGVILYTNPAWIMGLHVTVHPFPFYPTWIAEWKVSEPRFGFWKFWQYTIGHSPGIARSAVDLDWFHNDDEQEMRDLLNPYKLPRISEI